MPAIGRKKQLDEKAVDVTKKANAVAVRARDHHWISLVGASGEISRDQSGGAQTSFLAAPGSYVVRSDGKLVSVAATTIEMPALGGDGAGEAALLQLSSDAADLHPVDGVGEIAADGAAYCTMTLAKTTVAGDPLTRRKDDDEVFLRTTGGSLTDDHGAPVRSVKLSSGRAKFRLVSEAAPKIVTVEALGQPPLGQATLRVEFV